MSSFMSCARSSIYRCVAISDSGPETPLHTTHTLKAPVHIEPKPGRFIILVFLITALRGTWTLEQPSSSLMSQHRRFREFLRKFKVSWLNVCSKVCTAVAGIVQSKSIFRGFPAQFLDVVFWQPICQKNGDVLQFGEYSPIQRGPALTRQNEDVRERPNQAV